MATHTIANKLVRQLTKRPDGLGIVGQGNKDTEILGKAYLLLNSIMVIIFTINQTVDIPYFKLSK